MVCESGELQFVGLYEILTRRIHQPLEVQAATVWTTLTQGYIQFTVWVL